MRSSILHIAQARLNETSRAGLQAANDGSIRELERTGLNALLSVIDNPKIANNDAQMMAFFILLERCLGEHSHYKEWIGMVAVCATACSARFRARSPDAEEQHCRDPAGCWFVRY